MAFLHISVLSLGQDTTDVELERFNKFLGLERAAALSEAVDSFDRFLLTNYPEFDNSRDRSRAFLKQIAQHNKPNESWILETERNAKIIESFESTGLRKEIWVYGYEAYESEHDFSKVLPPVVPDTPEIHELGELDIDLVEDETVPIGKVDTAEIARRAQQREEARLNSLSTNYEGDYLYALLRYAPQDSFAYDFAAAM
ncbi:MAG: hypothetical protein ABR574_09555 [Cryomorphaceae bacterium]